MVTAGAERGDTSGIHRERNTERERERETQRAANQVGVA